MGYIPPTLVSTTKSALDNTDRTVEVEAQEGDLLLAAYEAESCLGNGDWEISGGGLTWTEQVDERDSAAGEGENDKVSALDTWTAEAASTGKVSVTTHQFTGSSVRGVLIVQVWRNHGGVGAKKGANNKKGSGLPELSLTTEQEHSALACFGVDWNAVEGAPAWEGSEVSDYQERIAGVMGVYNVHFADAEGTGSKTIKQTAPSGQRWRLAVLEIKGLAEETPQELTPDEDLATEGWTETPLFSKLNDAKDETVVKATLA